MFGIRESTIDRLVRESAETAEKISRIDTGMQQLAQRQLQDARSRIFADAGNDSATSVSVTLPTNNYALVSTILIVVGSGVGTLTLKVGGRTWPTVANPVSGIIAIALGEDAIPLRNTDSVTLTSQNAGQLYLAISGRQVGNAMSVS